ncbi:glycosyltransferase family 39 protein [Candidatus Chloroploca sp. M-50]|uniref:Glycosyltransferase family 39 protein n=1 Tax=Candidatus Chloroploca mongolica TaxID=2528176 RepID=A0ABS4DDZ2_9CHLR|nr:glycosyltransferase family 39 protein [Candidatus Chloroploca mongolica]MBP1467658.1 glycosyltransferase family 39 protein [Candidatus Chloroploca mongolica]
MPSDQLSVVTQATQRGTTQGWRRLIRSLPLLLIVLAALAVLWLGLRPPTFAPVASGHLDLGPTFLDGVYGPEVHPDGYTYRWTTGAPLLQMRGAFYAAPAYLATIRLRAEHPEAPQPFTMLVGGRPVAEATPEAQFRTYRMLLGPGSGDGAELWLALQTPTFVASGENPRPLGVVLTDLRLMPVAQFDLRGAMATALGLLLLWGALRLAGVPAPTTLALITLAASASVALVALPRPPVVPLIGLGTIGLISVFVAAVLAQSSTLAGREFLSDRALMPVSHHPPAPLAHTLLLSFFTLIVVLSGRIWPPWLSDDAFISFRYAQNLVQGHGLVYNPGERVEGYTNFLWTMLAALGLRLGGDLVIWSHLAGVVLGVVLVLLIFALTTRLIGAPWGLVAALIVATSQSVLLYTGRGSGLETGFFAVLMLAVACAYLWPEQVTLRTAIVTGLIAGLAALTRPEGAMVFALTAAHLFAKAIIDGRFGLSSSRRQREAPGQASEGLPRRASAGGQRITYVVATVLPLVGAFALLFVPYLLWRFSYYGDLLPNTFYAKTGGGREQIWRGLAYVGAFTLTLGGPLLLIILVPWVTGLRHALKSWRSYMLLVVVIYTIYIILVGGDHFRGERFFVPLVPWFAILLADGLAQIMRLQPVARIHPSPGNEGVPPSNAPRARDALAPSVLTPSNAPRGRDALAPRVASVLTPSNAPRGRDALAPRMVSSVLIISLLIAGSLAVTRTMRSDTDIIMQGLDESVWIWRELGWWLADQDDPTATMAAAGAGAVAFYSERTIIDMHGLTDLHIGRLAIEGMGSGVAGHEKRDPDYLLNVRRVTYIPALWDYYFQPDFDLNEQYELHGITTRAGRAMGMWVRR